MTKAQAKARLREELRAAERALSPAYKSRCDKAIAAHLLSLPEYQSAGTVFCFVGTAHEINTRPVLESALGQSKILCVPRCTAPGNMELRRITSLAQLSPGAYGILEPPASAPQVKLDEVDFAVIPCLSSDLYGHRLGQGGGYYDRFLSAYRAPAVLVCREELLRDEIPMEPFDCIVHWVVTERGLYEDGTPARPE